jgi:hypothetical protein
MKKRIRLILLLISVTTLLSGLIQLFAPGYVLEFVGTEMDTNTKQLFSTIGMFMFLFGAMMVHVLYSEEDNRVAVIWSGLQKLAASVAVFVGIIKGVFVPLVAVVALFDLLSGLLFFYYLKTLKSYAGS